MSERNVRWLFRRCEQAFYELFTMYLFWINKPGWKWAMLLIAILNGLGTVEVDKQDDEKLK